MKSKNTLCHHSLTLEKIVKIFSQNKVSKTKVKIKLLQILSNSHRPLSAMDLHQLLGEKNCNLSTVFRSITQFKEKNIIQEVDLKEGFYRYEIQDIQTTDEHHHHIRCRNCGTISSFVGCKLDHLEKEIKSLGFKDIIHHLEFIGICKKCSK